MSTYDIAVVLKNYLNSVPDSGLINGVGRFNGGPEGKAEDVGIPLLADNCFSSIRRGQRRARQEVPPAHFRSLLSSFLHFLYRRPQHYLHRG